MGVLMSDFLQFEFLQLALIGSIILSVLSGLLSPLVVAKEHAFIGSALSHSTLLGVALSLSLVEASNSLGLFASTFAITWIMVMILGTATYKEKLPSDALIGIFLTSTMGLAVGIHQTFSTGSSDLMSYLFGQIILLDRMDILLSFMALGLTFPIIWGRRHYWQIFLFDPQGANLMGLPIKRYHYLFYTLIALFIVVGVKLCGTIMINSLLLAPGIFALKRAKTLKGTFLLGITFSLVSTVAGLIFANLWDLPPGATIAVAHLLGLILAGAKQKVS